MLSAAFLPLLFSLFFTGGLAGILAGLMGIGGGIVLVPALYYVFTFLGYDPALMMHMAVGTSLAIMVPTALSSSRAHVRRGAVRIDILKAAGPGIFTGVLIGTLTASVVSGTGLKLFFAIAILLLAIIMIAEPGRFKLMAAMPGRLWQYIVGTVIGTVASMMGIGGATMTVPFMRICQIPIHTAVGTAAALGLFVSIPGMFGFWLIGAGLEGRPPFSLGYINLLAWAVIVPVSVIFAPLGAKLAHSLPVKMMQKGFALLMMIIAARMMADVIYG